MSRAQVTCFPFDKRLRPGYRERRTTTIIIEDRLRVNEIVQTDRRTRVGLRNCKETRLNRTGTALMGMVLLTGAALAADEQAPENISAKLLKLHRDEASRWDIFVDAQRTNKAKFVSEPVYRWTNASRANGQTGAMFVWTFEGRPVAIGGVFSNPEAGRRVIMHEFHALGPLRITAQLNDSKYQWLPGAGVPVHPLPDSPVPAATAKQRATQMRDIAREFTAHTVDDVGVRWQLRLLSRPLFRYEKPENDVIDGALFAFVSDAGTDPEIILVLEAVKTGEKVTWHYRSVRFSISSLYVQYKGKDVWTSLRDRATGVFENPDNTYGLIRDRLIDEFPELDQNKVKAP